MSDSPSARTAMNSPKMCSRCGLEKPLDRFSRDLRSGGYRQPCKDCTNLRLRTPEQRAKQAAAQRVWRRTHPERNWAMYLRKWGLTPETYEVMAEAAGGLCAICRQPCPTGQRLSVDHDHATGRVRGLLCRTCNVGIGNLKDDPALLARAILYLEEAS